MAHQTSSPTIMDFLQRYQALQAYRVTGDTLIQVRSSRKLSRSVFADTFRTSWFISNGWKVV